MSGSNGERWIVELADVPPGRRGGHRPPMQIRVRQLLKLGLRALGLRCESVRRQAPAPQDGRTANNQHEK